MSDEELSSNEFTPCRFSLTEEVVKMIETMAEDEYGGNKSAVVRDAIRTKYQGTDETELRRELTRIRQLLEEKLEEQETATAQQTAIMNRQPPDGLRSELSFGETQKSIDYSDNNESPEQVARKIYHHLRESDNGLVSLATIDKDFDESFELLASGTQKLVDKNVIERVEKHGSVKFRIVNEGRDN
jgi:Arc/MetJ-type ribon-helix-helix transcriptional regulator